MNRKYGKLDEYGMLVYAPNAISVNGQWVINPAAATYAAAGWLPVVDEPPVEPAAAGYHYERGGWEVADGAVCRVYNLVADPAPTLDDFDRAMEDHLRKEREERGYTTREPDSYLTSSVPRWSQDAMDWVAHRDEVMEYALTLINSVKAGEREPPTMEEFVEGLPKIEWTYQEEA